MSWQGALDGVKQWILDRVDTHPTPPEEPGSSRRHAGSPEADPTAAIEGGTPPRGSCMRSSSSSSSSQANLNESSIHSPGRRSVRFGVTELLSNKAHATAQSKKVLQELLQHPSLLEEGDESVELRGLVRSLNAALVQRGERRRRTIWSGGRTHSLCARGCFRGQICLAARRAGSPAPKAASDCGASAQGHFGALRLRSKRRRRVCARKSTTRVSSTGD